MVGDTPVYFELHRGTTGKVTCDEQLRWCDAVPTSPETTKQELEPRTSYATFEKPRLQKLPNFNRRFSPEWSEMGKGSDALFGSNLNANHFKRGPCCQGAPLPR